MKIRLLCMGKSEDKAIRDLLVEYTTRINHYADFTIEEIPAVRHPGSLNTNLRKEKESELIASKLKPDELVVLLDERGRETTSAGFAASLQKWFHTGKKSLTFIVGGAFGVGDAVTERAAFTLSLSRMTIPHQLVRILFAEQLYRAFTIMKNEAYHHE